MSDWVTTAMDLPRGHPTVTSVEFAGSRSGGTHAELSDRDFAVQTSDFDAIARDLPVLVAPVEPLSRQWEPMGHFPVFQVLLRGPAKIEYLFLDQSQEPLPPREPSPQTLGCHQHALRCLRRCPVLHPLRGLRDHRAPPGRGGVPDLSPELDGLHLGEESADGNPRSPDLGRAGATQGAVGGWLPGIHLGGPCGAK